MQKELRKYKVVDSVITIKGAVPIGLMSEIKKALDKVFQGDSIIHVDDNGIHLDYGGK